MPYSQAKTKRRKGETGYEHRDRDKKAKSIEASGDSRINKGSLASLAKRSQSETQAEAVESAKPKGGGEQKDVDDPAPKSAAPKRGSYPKGLAGDAAYQKALRAYRRKNK